MKPNFLIIGAARSGTTSLFQYLDHHPHVVMSPVKELNFFSNEKYWKKGFDWYENRFPASHSSATAIGEASTSYTQYPFIKDVPKRIFDYNPNIKLIYVVRDPLERFVSHYLQRVKAGHETRDFDDVFRDLDNEAFAHQGKYYEQITQYLKYFDVESIKIVSFDDIKLDIETVIKDLFTFIDVDPSVDIEGLGAVHNSADKVIRKNTFGLKVINFYHEHIEQRDMPYKIKKIFINAANIGGDEVVKPSLSSDQALMLRDFYGEDCQMLERHFGIDTSEWLA